MPYLIIFMPNVFFYLCQGGLIRPTDTQKEALKDIHFNKYL